MRIRCQGRHQEAIIRMSIHRLGGLEERMEDDLTNYIRPTSYMHTTRIVAAVYYYDSACACALELPLHRSNAAATDSRTHVATTVDIR